MEQGTDIYLHLPEGKLPDPPVKAAMNAMSLVVEDRHGTVRDLQAEMQAFQFGGKKRAEFFRGAGLFAEEKWRGDRWQQPPR